jgi:hypothetical protein
MIKVTGDVSLPLGISLDEVRLDFLDWTVPLRIISFAIPQTKIPYMSIRYVPVLGAAGREQSAIERLIVVLSTYGRATRRAGAE